MLHGRLVFDHMSQAYSRDVPELWRAIRESETLGYSRRFGGVWLPTRYDDIREICYDTDTFSSRQVIITELKTDPSIAPVGNTPPITSDPPFHALVRRLLVPLFRGENIAQYGGFTRKTCSSLLSKREINVGSFNLSRDYADHIPVAVIARMLGFPSEDHDQFMEYTTALLEGAGSGTESVYASIENVKEYVRNQVEARKECPADDLTTVLLNSSIGGVDLEVDTVVGAIILLLVAGIDTTRSALEAALWHLAGTPKDYMALRGSRDLIPDAVEELLRAYAPVSMGRLVTRNCGFRGETLRTGEWVLLPFQAANRDPARFPKPDTIEFERSDKNHAAFGLGIHRCLGAPLARMELKVAIEEFVGAFAECELVDPDAVVWSVGQVRGPRSVEVRLQRDGGVERRV